MNSEREPGSSPSSAGESVLPFDKSGRSRYFGEPAAAEAMALEQLHLRNPIPQVPSLSAAEHRRAEDLLVDILSGEYGLQEEERKENSLSSHVINLFRERVWATSQARWLAVAAVTIVVGTLAANIPVFEAMTPVAVADSLHAAGEASARQPRAQQLGGIGRDYLKRVDSNRSGTITTEYSAQGPLVESQASASGTPNFAVPAEPKISAAELLELGDEPKQWERLLGERYDNIAVGCLDMLLHPGLSNTQQKLLFNILAKQPGIQKAKGDFADFFSTDKVESFVLSPARGRGEEDIHFSILSETGQLIRVFGLVAPDVETRVRATAIIGCVSAIGTEGPEEMSLACADNNHFLTGMQWNDWGSKQATAHAISIENTCDPDCANGTFVHSGVDVVADEPQQCGFDATLYTRLRVMRPDGSEETFRMGCDWLEPS